MNHWTVEETILGILVGTVWGALLYILGRRSWRRHGIRRLEHHANQRHHTGSDQ